MKTFIAATVVAITSLSFSAEAKTVKIKPTDEKFDTQVCVTGATQGLDAAKAMISNAGLSYSTFERKVSCNYQSLRAFSNRYFNTPEAIKAESNNVKLVARDNVISKICADATVVGIDAAFAKHGIEKVETKPVYCNAMSIEKFVRTYNSKNVTVAAL